MFQKIICLSSFLIIVSVVCFSQDTTSKEIIFASDTQSPLWIESIFNKHHYNNKLATKILFKSIAIKKPSSLFLTGDVVALGFRNKYWKVMDTYLNPLKKEGVSTYAVLGNHDVFLFANKGIRKFEKRFTEHNKTGYFVVQDSVAIVMLNSNLKKLSVEERMLQDDWYQSVLPSLDSNASIKIIIVCCHHSPYSNSKTVGSNKPVQEKFIPLFNTTSKCKLFISGHSHNFEKFTYQNKYYFVIGGGGGLIQPLNKDSLALKDDVVNYKPMFHFLGMKRYNNSLHIVSYKMNSSFTGFEEGYIFDILL